MVRSLLCIAFTATLIGCATSGQIGDLPTIPAGEASSRLVLIRVRSIVGATNSYYVALDGEDVFSIRSGEYTEFDIPTVEHFVSVKCFGGWTPTWKEKSKRFVATSEQANYFLISPNIPCATIAPVASDVAKAHIAESKFVSPAPSIK